MKASLEIQNLKCNGCANTIKNSLAKLETISNIEIHVTNSTVSFDYTSDETIPTVKHHLKQLGYPIIGDKNAMTTKAKSFVSCAIGKLNN